MNQVTIDLEKPTVEDFKWIKDILEDYVKETESIIGQKILDNWEKESNTFIKVGFKNKTY